MMAREDRAAHAKADPELGGCDPMELKYQLVTFDPGERTGYCRVCVAHDFDPKTGDGFWIAEQGVLSISEVFRDLAKVIEPADVVEYETWRLYESHALSMIGNDFQPSQVVGMIRYEAHKQAKKIKSWGADIKKSALKTMPQWLHDHCAKSSEMHDQDAVAHAWFYTIERHYRDIS